jgi:hypothetical protein
MRSLTDTYRNHFPAVILGRFRDPVTRRWRYAWAELTPGDPDSYSVQPGARSGTVDLNYALEENNAQVDAGRIVWMRHRDEDGGALHFAFAAPSSRVINVTPPGPPASGSPPASLCLTITNESGCACLAGTYTLEFIDSLGYWLASAEVCGKGYEFIYRAKSGGGYELALVVVGTTIGDGFATIPSLPYEAEGVAVTGDACTGTIGVSLAAGPCGGCDETIGGSGTLCFGPDVILSFQNTFPLALASSVCPVWSTLEPGAGIAIDRLGPTSYRIRANGGAAEGETISFVSGLVVQKQTLLLPVGLDVSAPGCVQDPADCCASGGAAGCCFPRPPDRLFAWRTDASAGCACLLDCVELTYDAGRDAWYGGPIGDVCATTSDVLLRLKCILGAYHLDCVLRGATPADADLVGLSGVERASPSPSCDPFLSAWDFDDPAPDLCAAAGTFSYLLSESDCSGGGGGGTVATDCCADNLLPVTLHATFGGALSGLGTVTFTFDSGGILGATWKATVSGCGGMSFSFLCLGTSRHWGLTSLGGTVVDLDAEVAASSCSPFLWTATGVASGACAGAFSVTISE